MQVLNISHTSLTGINSPLKEIRELYCNDNNEISNIESLGYELKKMHCTNCPKLKKLPLLSPMIEEFIFDDTIESIGGFDIKLFDIPFNINKYKKYVNEYIKYIKARLDKDADDKTVFEYIVFIKYIKK